METVEKLREIIAHTENLVFFGGEAVSTESGIPDFRKCSGLLSPAVGITAGNHFKSYFFQRNPKIYRFYRA